MAEVQEIESEEVDNEEDDTTVDNEDSDEDEDVEEQGSGRGVVVGRRQRRFKEPPYALV